MKWTHLQLQSRSAIIPPPLQSLTVNKSIRAPWLCIANDFPHTSHCPALGRSYASVYLIYIQKAHLEQPNKQLQRLGSTRICVGTIIALCSAEEAEDLTQSGVKHKKKKVQRSWMTQCRKIREQTSVVIRLHIVLIMSALFCRKNNGCHNGDAGITITVIWVGRKWLKQLNSM